MTFYRDDDTADEWDEEADHDEDSGDEPTVPCPYCRREMLEDTPRCPYCERYISAEDHAAPSKPVWVVATALVCLGIAIYWVFAAF